MVMGERSISAGGNNKTVHNCNCCVSNCTSRKGKNRALHFHSFPKKDASTVNVTNAYGILEEIDRREAWIKTLLMKKPVTKNMVVCSLHFEDGDYITEASALPYMKAPRLKASAVPSQNLPKNQYFKKVNKGSIVKRKSRLEKKTYLRNQDLLGTCNWLGSSEENKLNIVANSDLTQDEQSLMYLLLDILFLGT